jgi:hypothetical protein
MGKIYEKLEKIYIETGGKMLRRLGFWEYGSTVPVQIMSRHVGIIGAYPRERITDLRKKREATSARQTAEWGMLTMQASFPRIRDRFVYEERGERRIVLKMFVLLYNMRARMVGINQIRNTYMPHLLRNANEDVFF